MDETAPILLCYDRSPGARLAIAKAGALLPGRRALVLNLWHFPLELPAFGLVDSIAMEEEPRRLAAEAAEEGCTIARAAGLVASPLSACDSVEGTCDTVLSLADAHDADLIVLGARGLGGVRSLLLGSVSQGVLRHSHRAVLIVPPPVDVADASADASEARARAVLQA